MEKYSSHPSWICHCFTFNSIFALHHFCKGQTVLQHDYATWAITLQQRKPTICVILSEEVVWYWSKLTWSNCVEWLNDNCYCRLSTNVSSEVTRKSSVSENNQVVTEVTLSIHNVNVEDNLRLECLAKNPVGKTTETVELRVYCKYCCSKKDCTLNIFCVLPYGI